MSDEIIYSNIQTKEDCPDCQGVYSATANCGVDFPPSNEAGIMCSNYGCSLNNFGGCISNIASALTSQGWTITVDDYECCDCSDFKNTYTHACCNGTVNGLVVNSTTTPMNLTGDCVWCGSIKAGIVNDVVDGQDVWRISRCDPA